MIRRPSGWAGRTHERHRRPRLGIRFKFRRSDAELVRPGGRTEDFIARLGALRSGPAALFALVRHVWDESRQALPSLAYVFADEWDDADRPLLRMLTPVLRRVLRWNHAWAIARAREGLEPYARAAAARVPTTAR